MLKKISTVLLLIVNSFIISAQIEETLSDTISLLFSGDIMGHNDQIVSALNSESNTWDYDDVFQYIKSEISEADISFANLEVTLAGPPYKGYPLFSSPASLAAACKNAGFDVLVTANNHAADRGKKGILGTVSRLDSLGILHTGTFTGPEARDSLYPMIIEKKGFTIALLNYTYGINGLTVPPPAIVNQLDKQGVAADIDIARGRNADVIILFLHWGTEYDTIPSKEQTGLADYFFSLGADLIIGSHPHVIQRMEWTKGDTVAPGRIVAYSLGNFVSNQDKIRTDGGAMIRIEMVRRADSLHISDAGYYLTWVYKPVENNWKKYYVLPCSKYEIDPDFFREPDDYRKMKLFITNSRTLLFNQDNNIKELIFSDGNWLY
jgi:poly-gamma-glutamate capsule biosynthesis protein CapA/YwtB (metallophosphatase superfamily)